MDLSKKVALVTGGTKGIGRAIAEALVSAGAGVAITARSEDEIGMTVAELKKLGAGTAAGYVCDVRNYEQVKAVVAEVAKEFGGLDILVNNAGVGIFASVESMPVEDFRVVHGTRGECQ